ncbi:MAG: leucine-rich repeat domain-containing protein, partial [Clostridia bacterium]|nr:leucine-rich repeat domain-containing protein [Clostridia bacterium]
TAVGENAFEKTAWYDQQPDGLVYAGKVAYRYKGDMPYDSKIVLKDGTTGIADFAFKNCYYLSEITIPGSVTNIGQSAFYYCYNLSTVEIPDGVTSIGDSAFSFCRELKSIEIPSQVASIGKNAFLNCNSLTAINVAENNSAFSSEDGILFTKDKTTLLVYPANKDAATYSVPGTVTSIADGALNQKRDLISTSDKAAKLRLIVIPDSVTEIGSDAIPKDVGIRCNPGSYAWQWAQENNMVSTSDPNIVQAGRIGEDATYQIDNKGICTISGSGATRDYRWNSPSPLAGNDAIQKIVIEKGITTIGDRLFENCEGLTGIEVPDGISSIGSEAFYKCNLLADIKLPSSLTNIGSYAFYHCGITEITVPASVTLSYGVFSYCTQLERATLAEGITDIGSSMFAYCDNLREVVIPTSVKSIGEGAFSNCKNLPKVTVDKINSIGRAAFSYCDGLTDVKISEQTESIGDAPFYCAKNLQSIDVAAENKNYTSVDGVLFNKELTRLIAYPAGKKDSSYKIPDGVTEIVYGAFASCANLTEIEIPDSVHTIGGDAFRGCSGLTSITLPGSLKSIGRYAFSSCSGLKSVIIPDGVSNIGDYAFSGCSSLTGIVIPPSVTEMGHSIVGLFVAIYGQAGSYAQEWAEKNGRVFIPIVDAYLSLNAPAIVNELSVTVHGFSSPGATVTLFVNGKQTATTTAAASGCWSASIPLTGAKDGDSFSLKATVTVNGKTAEQKATVKYQPNAVVFQEFTMTHRYGNVTVKANQLGLAKPNVTYIPDKPSSFRVSVTNNERIDKLFVVSTKDGDSKQMALTYDAASGCWFADGFFDEADKNYVPGVFTVKGVDKDGKEFDTGVTIKINFLIDPSGYAYEAVTSNKL